MAFSQRNRDPFWARAHSDFPLHYTKIRQAYEFGWSSFLWRMATGLLLLGVPPGALVLAVWAFEQPVLEWTSSLGDTVAWLTPSHYQTLVWVLGFGALALGLLGAMVGLFNALDKKNTLHFEAEVLEMNLRRTLILQMMLESEEKDSLQEGASVQLNVSPQDHAA